MILKCKSKTAVKRRKTFTPKYELTKTQRPTVFEYLLTKRILELVFIDKNLYCFIVNFHNGVLSFYDASMSYVSCCILCQLLLVVEVTKHVSQFTVWELGRYHSRSQRRLLKTMTTVILIDRKIGESLCALIHGTFSINTLASALW